MDDDEQLKDEVAEEIEERRQNLNEDELVSHEDVKEEVREKEGDSTE